MQTVVAAGISKGCGISKGWKIGIRKAGIRYVDFDTTHGARLKMTLACK
jgi:hypothetical protein